MNEFQSVVLAIFLVGAVLMALWLYSNEDNGRFYPFGEDVELYAVNPPTVESVHWDLKLKGTGTSVRGGLDGL